MKTTKEDMKVVNKETNLAKNNMKAAKQDMKTAN